MPYFNDIQKELEDALLWLDLRKEQGADVGKVVNDLKQAIRKARRTAIRLPLGTNTPQNEPNDLHAIRKLRPKGPRVFEKVPKKKLLADKIKGALIGRAIGCTLGHPVEGWSVDEMERLAKRSQFRFPPEDYWPDHPKPDEMRNYLRAGLKFIPEDDDLAYTVLGLLIFEEYGADFTTSDVAAAWQKYLPFAYTAEKVALENMEKGIAPEKAGEHNNPFQEWIGADIRSDPWAYLNPGNPEQAAEFAYRDAYLSHRGNGIYGAMFFAAAISAAFVVTDPIQALEIGLSEIPKSCRLAEDIRWALEKAPTIRDWREARAHVDQRFEGMHPVHTNNNACLTVFGLSLGRGDFTKTISITVAMGLDNDCTAATAGSILGAILGFRNLPPHWWKPFRGKMRTYLKGHQELSVSDLVTRFLRCAEHLAK